MIPCLCGEELFERFYGGGALSFLSEVQADQSRPMLERKYVEREVLSRFAEWLVKRGVAPKTVHVYASAIQSLGKFKGVDISLKYVKMPSVRVVNVKYAWSSADEVDSILSPHTSLLILLILARYAKTSFHHLFLAFEHYNNSEVYKVLKI